VIFHRFLVICFLSAVKLNASFDTKEVFQIALYRRWNSTVYWKWQILRRKAREWLYNYNYFHRKLRMRDVYTTLLSRKNALLMHVVSFFGQSDYFFRSCFTVNAMCCLSLTFLFKFYNSKARGLDVNSYPIFVFLRAIFPELSQSLSAQNSSLWSVWKTSPWQNPSNSGDDVSKHSRACVDFEWRSHGPHLQPPDIPELAVITCIG
jgi:hypothetical protein